MTEAAGRAAVAERSQGRCEACGMERATEVHHRLPRSGAGTWSPANLLHLCNGCHGLITDQREPITGEPVDTYQLGLHVPRGLSPALRPVRLSHPVYGGGWWRLHNDGTMSLIGHWSPPRRAEQLPTHKHTRVIRDALGRPPQPASGWPGAMP